MSLQRRVAAAATAAIVLAVVLLVIAVPKFLENEREIGERQRFAERRSVAAQQRPHPRAQLVDVERLDQVVVGARVQAGHAFVHGIAGGQQEDRHPQPLRPQPARDREPVHAGHRHVEHDRVGQVALDRGQRRTAVGGGDDLVALGRQGPLEHPPDRGVVVDQEKCGFRHSQEGTSHSGGHQSLLKDEA